MTDRDPGGVGPSPDASRRGWHLIRTIAVTRTSEVWLADHAKEFGIAALKTVDPRKGDVSRFERELQLARKLDGQWTPRVLDAGLDDPVAPWIAFQYLGEHRTLEACIEESGPLQASELTQFARDLWNVVQTFHRLGVAHRDLSFRNVLIDGTGRPWVIDLGLSTLVDRRDETATIGEVKRGTRGFYAPEQLYTDEPTGPAADLWSWAAVVYFAATGKTTFPSNSYETKLRDSTKPGLKNVPAELRPSLAAAFTYNPSKRTAASIEPHLPELPHERDLRVRQEELQEAQRALATVNTQLSEARARAARAEARLASARERLDTLVGLNRSNKQDIRMLRASVKRLNQQLDRPQGAFGRAAKAFRTAFKGADLSNRDFAGEDLAGTKVAGTNFKRADFTNSRLERARLSGLDLTGASFEGADLTGADLTKAYLGGAKLADARLAGVKLTGASYSASTTWPDKFDPSAAGAELVVVQYEENWGNGW
jgi:uncharacterized protein YjbI with pentapeptide repeats